MATQQVEFDGDLWFFTLVDSPKVEESQHYRDVNVSFANPEKQHYVSVSGTATLVRDRRKIEELWNPFYRTWFPQGLDDPNIALLKVHAEKAEYWDSPSSAVVHLFGVVKATLTGKPPHPGEKVTLD
jgi:general stress protein 26